jgi:hypothetical protein
MTTSKQAREPVPPSLSRSFGALGVVAQFFARVTHWAPGGPSRHDAMVSLTQHTRLVGELAVKVQALQAQVEQTRPMLEQARTAIERLQAAHESVRQALEMAASINPYGSVENARARDAASQALKTLPALQSVQVQAPQTPQHDAIERAAAVEPPKSVAMGRGRYGLAQIAWELERTALGEAFYGNALRVAKGIQGLSDQDRSLLDRYATGAQRGTDHVALQQLATFVDVLARHEALVLGEGHHDRHGHSEDDLGPQPDRHQTCRSG